MGGKVGRVEWPGQGGAQFGMGSSWVAGIVWEPRENRITPLSQRSPNKQRIFKSKMKTQSLNMHNQFYVVVFLFVYTFAFCLLSF